MIFSTCRKAMLYLAISLFVVPYAGAQDADDCVDSLQCQSAWLTLSADQSDAVFQFAEEYKEFIHLARTELSFVTEAISFAEANGFRELNESSSLAPGSRHYEVNRDRTISLIIIGEQPMENGFHVIGAHIDSPRLDLKGRPLYEGSEFALFQTNYHGGIKYHQWTNLPLALMGRIDRKDGSTVNLSIGLDPEDPVFMIPELSPHVDRSRNSQTLGDYLEPEDMDPVVAHIPVDGGDSVDQVLSYLAAQYGVSRADLVSAR
ncbi:MAG: hypothetical protein RL120_02275 [Gammaproteobacteria bacterium]